MDIEKIDAKIAKIEVLQNQLKQQKKKLKAEQSKRERNERTKRLIEVGSIVEKALEIELSTAEKKEKLFSILTQERRGRENSTYSYASFFRKEIENE